MSLRALFRSQPVLFIALALFSFSPLGAQQIADSAVLQMRDVLTLKKSFTLAQRKQSTDLVFAAMRVRGESLGTIPMASVRRPRAAPNGTILVDLRVNALRTVTQRIIAVGGRVLQSSARSLSIHAEIPVLNLDTVAALPDVRWMRSAGIPHTSVGSVTSQGYVTHTANQAVKLGFEGVGVKVGVLSDSASPEGMAARIASGDLPPDVVVVPGQDGAPGTDEGIAMMEIVHDIAPGAKLFFATAFTSEVSFADNIRTLRFTYGCDIIVDDVTYFDEGAFQDGIIADAVNDVTAAGALYLSSSGNDNNLTSRTSGTWEGDFKNGGDAGELIETIEGQPVKIHNFASSRASRLFDALISPGGPIFLKWSDPLGASFNDYDLFILDSTGTSIKAFSIQSQTGTQDPLEFIPPDLSCGTPVPTGFCPSAGDRIVAVLFNGAARALRIETNGGTVSIGTAGATYSHNAGASTFTIAATYWNSARDGTRPFVGPPNPTEVFSSDGPRKIFYNPNGTPITPNNFLFATNGGRTLQKPDAAAADGVFCKTPGFLPFFGTSAAAPHAAAIAAIVKSVNPALTNAQIKNILSTTTVDNMAPGVDRDSGHGIVMALPAVMKSLNP
jgi:subtilisin family serine protease